MRLWRCEIQVTLRNSQKTCELLRNSREILLNKSRYNIFETYHGYWGCLIAVNLQIYVETSSPQWVNVPKLPGVNYVAKNWVLVLMLKFLPLAHFSNALLLEYQNNIIISVKSINHTRQISATSIDF